MATVTTTEAATATTPNDDMNSSRSNCGSSNNNSNNSNEHTTTSTISTNTVTIPQCCFHGNQEALGWCIDNSVTIVSFIGVGAFLGTALLTLANEEASTSDDGKIYGVIKPSSLLINNENYC